MDAHGFLPQNCSFSLQIELISESRKCNALYSLVSPDIFNFRSISLIDQIFRYFRYLCSMPVEDWLYNQNKSDVEVKGEEEVTVANENEKLHRICWSENK